VVKLVKDKRKNAEVTMSRKTLCVFFLLLCVASFLLAEEGSHPFTLTAKTDFALCLFEAYVVPNVSFTWQPGRIGVGVDLRSLVGLRDGDVYGLACVDARIGRFFYIGGGLCVPISYGDSGAASSSESVTPALTLGFDIPIISIGPGKLGINAGMDYLITWDTLTNDNDLGAALGNAIWAPTYGAIKADIGLIYSLSF